jgi:hypothetical protein
MAKKKFSQGLDDLFKEVNEPLRSGGAVSEVTVRQPERRLPSVKSFAQDLDALLHEAMEESLGRLQDNTEVDTPRLSAKSKSENAQSQSRITGLDALIRQTIDVQELTREDESGTRRLTVSVDRSKLEKLKTIARLENTYLKDIMIDVIDEFIQEYVRDKGIAL